MIRKIKEKVAKLINKLKSKYNNLNMNKKTIIHIIVSIILIAIVIELLNKNFLFFILIHRLLLNFILIALVYCILICITNKLKLSIIVSNCLLFGIGFANYSMITLRGTPLSMLDVLSIDTGLTIAETYSLVISPYLIFATIGFIVLIIINVKTNYEFSKFKKNSVNRLWGFIGSIALMFLICSTSFIKIFFLNTNLWNPSKEYHKNGFLASYVKQINDLIIKKPDNYSVNKVKRIYEDTVEKDDNQEGNTELAQEEDEKKPNIIVIMNESFADMRVHHYFKTSEEYMPYFKSLLKNTINGYVHTSVYGAKTPNSEWEFLTSNSMAFFSYGSIPYQQFVSGQAYSLVSTLEGQGYSSSAIHTWYRNGYRRSSVYPSFGFDSFISYEDVKDEVTLVRDYPSDLSTYKVLTKQFEERDLSKPFFNFTVTMQNHSGYDYDKGNFESTVFLTDIPDCPKVEQYLSLIKKADEDLKYLINYFENVDEHTIILFFGDHQPPYIEQEFWDYINQDKTDSLEDAEKGYLTPYFIWANYDLEDVNVPDISLNYLSTLLLDLAGLKTTPYQDYLRNMQQEIPVITGHGYMDKTGTYHNFTEENEYTTLINDYAILEYNNMFGGKNTYKKMFEIQK